MRWKLFGEAMNKKYKGSNFDDFLKEEKIYEQVQSAAITRVTAYKITEEMWWDMTIAKSEEKIQQLAQGRGLDWEQMSEDERAKFVDDLMHE